MKAKISNQSLSLGASITYEEGNRIVINYGNRTVNSDLTTHLDIFSENNIKEVISTCGCSVASVFKVDEGRYTGTFKYDAKVFGNFSKRIRILFEDDKLEEYSIILRGNIVN